MAEPTVAAGIATAFIDLAASKSADRRELLARSDIDPDDLADQDNRIPLAKYIALIEAGKEFTGDPALALHFGEAFSMPELSIVGLVGDAAMSVDEAYRTMNRFAPLIVDAGDADDAERFAIHRTPDGFWTELASDIYTRYPQLAESAFARSIRHIKRQFPDVHVVKAVRFAHREPDYRNEYDRIFEVPIAFGADRNAMLIDERFFSLKLSPSNPYVSGILSEHAEKLLKRLQNSKTMKGKVESLLVPLLPAGGPSMTEIADKLGVSRQTLFRKLKAEGVTFEKVLDALRHDMALDYLEQSGVSVNETAYLVGFSDPAAFSRAFKRWTGESPRVARSRKGGGRRAN